MTINALNPSLPNDKDVRPQVIVAALTKMVEEYAANNWNILEIATLSIKIMEQMVLHCKEHKIDYPKKLNCTLADNSGEIEYTFKSHIPTRFNLQG